jgi:dipeptidyl aminopeptidase/acylaminoacyl peptidase
VYRKRARLTILCVMLATVNRLGVSSSADEKVDQHKKRPVTVHDAIEMSRLGDPSYLLGGSAKDSVANFSPDGKRFIITLTNGDVEQNSNHYSLLLFETSTVFNSPKPEVLLTMSSSSNREAIRDLRWLTDNETLVFIGENRGEPAQVYTLSVRTKLLNRLTDHPTSIVAFDATENLDDVIFAADPPNKPKIDTEKVRRDGILVSNQTINQLLAGDCYTVLPSWQEGEELFLMRRGRAPIRIQIEDVVFDYTRLSLSPDGKYALVEPFVRNVPKEWSGYQDKSIRRVVLGHRERGLASVLKRYLIVETATGTVSTLIDTPSDSSTDGFAWGPDRNSVILSGAYLPLDVPDPVERANREKNAYVAEISLPDKKVAVISGKNLRIIRSDPDTSTIILDRDDSDDSAPRVAYEKAGSGWKEIPISHADDARTSTRLKVRLKEDSNTPPMVYVTDPKSNHDVLVLDLNPQFASLNFAKVEAISWMASDGHTVSGGLYLPPNYIAGKRYPLVIQTHGFSSERFMIDGPWTSVFAAQPLASKGFVVLQVGGSEDKEMLRRTIETPQEAPSQMAEYEGAIDYLDSRGLIDRNRVGIIGFSRTVYIVEYTLTHSRYQFSAASLADGINGGYFSYLVFPSDGYDLLNGGTPFGDALALWFKNSPGFNLDKVRTPVRLESYGFSGSVLSEWEWFSGLSLLHRPVELIYLPYAPHILVKPWERMTSQQGTVDWFAFWLKGEEDSDATKHDQYARWRQLCSLQPVKEASCRVSFATKQ